MEFGLMFFAANEAMLKGNKYHLIFECARFADQNQFSSVWVPELHFSEWGALYPNPAVLQAAIARETSRIRLRASSIILPLHNPLRLVEEWAMVDNLSQGRVEIACTAGWNPNDFAFSSKRYEDKRYENRAKGLFTKLALIQSVWRGDDVELINGLGQLVKQKVYPTPIQSTLPIWVTVINDPINFARAGEIGTNLLTHLFDEDIETLAERIAIYRLSRAKYGFDPQAGKVAVMLYTFVGNDVTATQAQARKPYCDYLKANVHLLDALALSQGESFNSAIMTENDIDNFIDFLYDSVIAKNILIGSVESCFELVTKLHRIGVDEIACCLDFGLDTDAILGNLPYLNELRHLVATTKLPSRYTVDKETVENKAQTTLLQARTLKRRKAEKSKTKMLLLSEIRARCKKEVPLWNFYNILRERGIQIEGSFRGIVKLWQGKNEAIGHLKLDINLQADLEKYQLHPAFLDACLQVFAVALPADVFSDNEDTLYFPVGFKQLHTYGPLPDEVWSHAILNSSLEHSIGGFTGDIYIFDTIGNLLVKVLGLNLQQLETRGTQSVQRYLEQWLYDLTWKPKVWTESNTLSTPSPALWLILADKLGFGEALATHLNTLEHQAIIVVPGEKYEVLTKNKIQINPKELTNLEQLLTTTASVSNMQWGGIIHLWSLNTTSVLETNLASLQTDQQWGIESILPLLKTLSTLSLNPLPKLWLITGGAQPLKLNDGWHEDSPPAIVQSILWGFARTIPLEMPLVWGGLIDVDLANKPQETAKQITNLLWCKETEDQYLIREKKRYVLRLTRLRKPPIKIEPLALFKDATFLITGGLGSLGLRIARWLISQRVKQLVLLGRHEPNEETKTNLSQINKAETTILTLQGDVSNETDMKRVLEKIKTTGIPLRGIFHLAGLLDYCLIKDMDNKHFREMLDAKVYGTWILQKLTNQLSLDFFVCVSSLSPVWGTKGLAHYAAVNHFQDIFAYYGQQKGWPITTINLGPLGGGGMASVTSERQALVEGTGLGLLNPSRAIKILSYFVQAGVAQQIVADVDWGRFKQIHELVGVRSLLADIEIKIQDGIASEVVPTLELLHQLQAAASKDRKDLLITHLQAEVVRILRLDWSKQPDPQRGFFDMGMDSLLALELRTRLQNDLGLDLPATLSFEYPTIEAMSTYLLHILFDSQREIEQYTVEEQDSAQENLEEVTQLNQKELMALIDAELETLLDD